MNDDERELKNTLNALAECVRELALARWQKGKEMGGNLAPTLAESHARELLAMYKSQFEDIEIPD